MFQCSLSGTKKGSQPVKLFLHYSKRFQLFKGHCSMMNARKVGQQKTEPYKLYCPGVRSTTVEF